MSASEAAALVETGDTVAVSGVVSLLSPEAALKALGERFRDTAEPKGLTVICPCRTGWSAGGATTGLDQ